MNAVEKAVPDINAILSVDGEKDRTDVAISSLVESLEDEQMFFLEAVQDGTAEEIGDHSQRMVVLVRAIAVLGANLATDEEGSTP